MANKLQRSADIANSQLPYSLAILPIPRVQMASRTIGNMRAGVEPGNEKSAIFIGDPKNWNDPAYTPQLLGHEKYHLKIDRLPEKLKKQMPPINPKDPYGYGGVEGLIAVGGDPLRLSTEQGAAIIQEMQAAKQRGEKLDPIYEVFQKNVDALPDSGYEQAQSGGVLGVQPRVPGLPTQPVWGAGNMLHADKIIPVDGDPYAAIAQSSSNADPYASIASSASVPTTGRLNMPMRQAEAIQQQNAPLDAVSNATALNNFLSPAGMTVGALAGGMIAGPVGAAAGAAYGGGVGRAAAQHAQGLDTNALPQIKEQGEDAAIGLGTELLIPAIAGLWSRVPTAAKAGKLFDEVMQAAQDEPVTLTRSQSALDRVAQLTDAGAPVMTAPNKLMLRSQTINPIPYQEARDFYSNISNLSAQDKLALNGPMKRAVGDLREAFKNDIGDAAALRGKGKEYYDAMKQYRRAARNSKAAKTAVKYALPAIGSFEALRLLQEIMGKK